MSYSFYMSNSDATTAARYRIIGTTDDITTCDACGRTGLTHTIVLAITDPNGDTDGHVHFGSVCGARAAGMPVRDLLRHADAADRAARANDDTHRAARVAANRAREAEQQAFAEWLHTTYHVTRPRDTGIAYSTLRCQFDEIYGTRPVARREH